MQPCFYFTRGSFRIQARQAEMFGNRGVSGGGFHILAIYVGASCTVVFFVKTAFQGAFLTTGAQ